MPKNDYEYIYDPDHEKHPGQGYHKTEKGWSKTDNEKNFDRLTDSEHRKKIINSLFSQRRMNAKDVFNKETTMEQHYRSAGLAQELMVSNLDQGKERQWLGHNAKSTFDLNPRTLNEKGPLLILAPLKAKGRAKEKVDSNFNGDWTQLKDSVRCSIAVDSFEQLPNVIKNFQKTGCKIVGKPKNRLKKRLDSGYGDVLCNADFGNGFIGEVQFHLKSMIAAKQFGGGHHLYETQRILREKCGGNEDNLSEQDRTVLKENLEQQRRLYNSAFDNARVRMSRMNKLPKYMLSDDEFSYFLYGDAEQVAYCYKNKFPKFWNGARWVTVDSWLKFSNNAVRIDIAEFKKEAKRQGIQFK